MELTNEIKARIFGLYGIGAPVETADGPGSILCIYPAAIEVHLNSKVMGQEMKGRKGSGELHYKYLNKDNQVKLLLTKLENITDADCIKAYDCYPGSENQAINTTRKINSIKAFIEANDIPYDIGDALRSLGYHLPYNGINLFQSGIAIERTPTVQPRDKDWELHGDGTGHALPPIESHPIDEDQTNDPQAPYNKK